MLQEYIENESYSLQNQYGYKKEDGSWTGLVGDLIAGEIDISVATLTMTTERLWFMVYISVIDLGVCIMMLI